MPPLGKSQPEGARKPFNLADHSYGEQVDAVRLKIASLMDGVTENEEQQRTAIEHSENGAEGKSAEVLGYEQSAQHKNGVQFHQETVGTGESQEEPESQHSFTTPNPSTNFALRNGNDDESIDRAGEQDAHARHGAPTASAIAHAQVHADEPNEWPRRPGQAPVTPGSERSFHTGWNDTEKSGRAIHADPPLFKETSSGETSDLGAGGSRRGNETPPSPPIANQNSAPANSNPIANTAGNNIHIKGRAGGILIEIGKGEWPALMAALAERLAGAANFFRNGNAALELADRALTEPDLAQLHQLLKEQSLELVLIRTSSQETFQSALDMGLSAQLETAEGDTTATAQPALSNLLQEQHFVYTGHLRAGQILQRREHILILGDINPGATVVSDGDILVWGHLRGIAHAGAADGRGIICALNLAPVQLRIGDFIAIAPAPEKPKRGWGRQQSTVKQPELAYLAGDRINVEPWDATKFGGIAAFRRQK